MKSRGNPLVIILALVLVVLPLSCSRTKELRGKAAPKEAQTAVNQPSSSGQKTGQSQTPPPESPSAPRTPPTGSSPPAVPPTSPPPLAANTRAFSLGIGGSPRIAWDLSLGPLQPIAVEGQENLAILQTAAQFMAGLNQGKLDSKIILPAAKDALLVLLAPDPKAGKTAIRTECRFGAIQQNGDDASLKVRLASSSDMEDKDYVREEGLLSLRKSEGAWYIQGLALNAPQPGIPLFDPSALERNARDGQ